MNALFVAILSGALIFLAIYLGFDYWYEKVWGKMISIRDETYANYQDLFSTKSKDDVLRQQLYISGAIAGLFFVLMWPRVGIAIPFCAVVFWFSWRLPLIFLKHFVRPSRVGKFSVQMVDALTLMANGLKSGLNIPQTLQIVVDEMPDPISQEFGFVLSENRLGKPIEEAFENLGRRISSEDVSMFVTSVNILSETGGNIAETFQNITKTIRERLKLQSKIQAMTAQGMTSAVIVGALPWGLGVILYATDPVQMRPLFFHPVGWVILLMILMLESIGFFVILKIVKIKV
jgi:tight adherence protein B